MGYKRLGLRLKVYSQLTIIKRQILTKDALRKREALWCTHKFDKGEVSRVNEPFLFSVLTE